MPGVEAARIGAKLDEHRPGMSSVKCSGAFLGDVCAWLILSSVLPLARTLLQERHLRWGMTARMRRPSVRSRGTKLVPENQQWVVALLEVVGWHFVCATLMEGESEASFHMRLVIRIRKPCCGADSWPDV